MKINISWKKSAAVVLMAIGSAGLAHAQVAVPPVPPAPPHPPFADRGTPRRL
jgi:hypothetical protein